MPCFTSNILPVLWHQAAEAALVHALTPDDVRAVFAGLQRAQEEAEGPSLARAFAQEVSALTREELAALRAELLTDLE